MTRLARAGVLWPWLAIAAATTAPLAGQTFRASADVVAVDVSVEQGGRPVTRLTAKDFVVRDNGAVQTIADFSIEAVPLNVVLLLDASQSLDLHRDVVSTEGVRERLAKGVTAIPPLLRPIDSVQVLRFASGVSAIPARLGLGIEPAPERQRTALFDSLAAVLLQPIPTGQRRLVIVLTDGLDTSSAIDPELLSGVLDRSEGVVDVITMSTIRGGAAQFGPGKTFRDFAWRLDDIAHRTGGRHTEMIPGDDFGLVLKAAFQDFRARYVLRFLPTSAEAGWHALVVSVPHVKADVTYRTGYWR